MTVKRSSGGFGAGQSGGSFAGVDGERCWVRLAWWGIVNGVRVMGEVGCCGGGGGLQGGGDY